MINAAVLKAKKGQPLIREPLKLASVLQSTNTKDTTISISGAPINSRGTITPKENPIPKPNE
ncbi:hypothetical protein SLU01_23150 [Sporosarcina luteola]|uniref:Uncharacterized protein n=1 Tax=Sporosarcina luteola TaxID=582850 RepID=A0A511Z9C3_9BACL|nr:hypothetical protein SLU01_23150 [Sporosarcina luteola]